MQKQLLISSSNFINENRVGETSKNIMRKVKI